jgi:hypothetical protein
MGFIVECGACGGTGIARTYSAPEPEEPPEPEPPATGALDAATAFQRHYETIFRLRDEPVPEDYSAMHGIELFSACSRIDRRYMAELPNTIIGRTTAETAGRLESIAADYRRLAAEAHRGPLDREAIEKKIADATKSLAGARENLGETRAAERAYEAARAAYLRLGADWDARSCADSVARLRLHTGGDVDLALDGLHTRLDAATAPLDRAERQIELAELHLSRGDEFEAESRLRRAETALEPFMEQAGGTATADALVRSLSELMGAGAAPGAGMGIEETMRVRALLGRLYRGLMRVAPGQAAEYLDRLTQLEGSIDEGSTDNADFSKRMLSSLDSLLEQFDRRQDPQ